MAWIIKEKLNKKHERENFPMDFFFTKRKTEISIVKNLRRDIPLWAGWV
jgi:hypothetical protein